MHIDVHIQMCFLDVFHVMTAIEIFVHNALACAYTNTYEKYMHMNVHVWVYSVNVFHARDFRAQCICLCIYKHMENICI